MTARRRGGFPRVPRSGGEAAVRVVLTAAVAAAVVAFALLFVPAALRLLAPLLLVL